MHSNGFGDLRNKSCTQLGISNGGCTKAGDNDYCCCNYDYCNNPHVPYSTTTSTSGTLRTIASNTTVQTAPPPTITLPPKQIRCADSGSQGWKLCALYEVCHNLTKMIGGIPAGCSFDCINSGTCASRDIQMNSCINSDSEDECCCDSDYCNAPSWIGTSTSTVTITTTTGKTPTTTEPPGGLICYDSGEWKTCDLGQECVNVTVYIGYIPAGYNYSCANNESCAQFGISNGGCAKTGDNDYCCCNYDYCNNPHATATSTLETMSTTAANTTLLTTTTAVDITIETGGTVECETTRRPPTTTDLLPKQIRCADSSSQSWKLCELYERCHNLTTLVPGIPAGFTFDCINSETCASRGIQMNSCINSDSEDECCCDSDYCNAPLWIGTSTSTVTITTTTGKTPTTTKLPRGLICYDSGEWKTCDLGQECVNVTVYVGYIPAGYNYSCADNESCTQLSISNGGCAKTGDNDYCCCNYDYCNNPHVPYSTTTSTPGTLRTIASNTTVQTAPPPTITLPPKQVRCADSGSQGWKLCALYEVCHNLTTMIGGIPAGCTFDCINSESCASKGIQMNSCINSDSDEECCCDSDYCNAPSWIGTSTSTVTTTTTTRTTRITTTTEPPRGPFCYDSNDWKLCDLGQQCVNVTTYSGYIPIGYNYSCVDNESCVQLGIPNGGCAKTGDIEYCCCNYDYCNNPRTEHPTTTAVPATLRTIAPDTTVQTAPLPTITLPPKQIRCAVSGSQGWKLCDLYEACHNLTTLANGVPIETSFDCVNLETCASKGIAINSCLTGDSSKECCCDSDYCNAPFWITTSTSTTTTTTTSLQTTTTAEPKLECYSSLNHNWIHCRLGYVCSNTTVYSDQSYTSYNCISKEECNTNNVAINSCLPLVEAVGCCCDTDHCNYPGAIPSEPTTTAAAATSTVSVTTSTVTTSYPGLECYSSQYNGYVTCGQDYVCANASVYTDAEHSAYGCQPKSTCLNYDVPINVCTRLLESTACCCNTNGCNAFNMPTTFPTENSTATTEASNTTTRASNATTVAGATTISQPTPISTSIVTTSTKMILATTSTIQPAISSAPSTTATTAAVTTSTAPQKNASLVLWSLVLLFRLVNAKL